MKIDTPLRWHGGKSPLASKIRALFPPGRGTDWLHYVEPFAGGLSVLLADELGGEGISEVANDLNGNLINFWRTIQDLADCEMLRRRVEATPFSADEWNRAYSIVQGYEPATSIGKAWAFFVLCRQSLAGRMNSYSPISRTRTRRGMNEQVSGWLTAIEGLPAVHARLKRVLILNRPALDVIASQDGKKTLFYIDAPYVTNTRTAKQVYKHEMSDDDHIALVELLSGIEGRAVVSMYRHPIYDSLSDKHGWRRVDFDVANHASGAQSKRRMTECCWMNFPE